MKKRISHVHNAVCSSDSCRCSPPFNFFNIIHLYLHIWFSSFLSISMWRNRLKTHTVRNCMPPAAAVMTLARKDEFEIEYTDTVWPICFFYSLFFVNLISCIFGFLLLPFRLQQLKHDFVFVFFLCVSEFFFDTHTI